MRYFPWILLAFIAALSVAEAVQTGAGADTLTVVTATSYTIGGNTLDTNEWAFLDGQDQDVSSDATDVAFGSVNLGGGTFEIPNGTDLPATCTIGHLFIDTDDDSCADAGGGAGAMCACTATNTWTLATG
ncbi:MAG: hypothetical protein ACXADY_25200 [Candidatus Hodarchaeales archaeon]|jgi:hypothetical protein